MRSPADSLSPADISWIKLCRHDMECTECGGRRKKADKENEARSRVLLTIPPATWDYCDERKRLLKVHFENARREKTATEKRAERS